MDNKIAAILLTSLMERVDREQTIGIMSSLERQALQLAIQALVDGRDQSLLPVPSEPPLIETPPVPSDIAVTPTSQALPVVQKPVAESPTTSMPPALPKVKLVLDAIDREQASDPDVLMCLDFGTAMSKAFAAVAPDEYLDLELGAAAGSNGYTLPSSVFIGDDGKAYFGFEAIDLSQGLVGSGRERLDSIKGWLSLRREGNLDGDCLPVAAGAQPDRVQADPGRYDPNLFGLFDRHGQYCPWRAPSKREEDRPLRQKTLRTSLLARCCAGAMG